jgi:hypothetical protein
MGKHLAVLGMGFLILAVVAAGAGWFLFGAAATPTPSGWSMGPVWLYVAGALFIIGGLAGFLMWLAFYSADHGYDDRPDIDV